MIRRLVDSRPRTAVVLVFTAVVTAVTAAAFTAAVSDSIKVKDLARDPATLSGSRASDGALSTLSALGWAATIATVLLGATLLWRMEGRSRRVMFLRGAAVATAVLMVDDVFLIHERLAPQIHVAEEVLFSVYVIGYSTFVYAFRDVMRTTMLPLLAASGFFFAASLAVAFGPRAIFDLHHFFLSDTYTFIGTGAWLAYHLHTVLIWLDEHIP